MGKNLLSDTDYTKGRDNRFGVTAVVARVAKIEVSDKGANVRVVMPDRLDHQDQPLISKPIPVMQVASKAKRSFMVPRLKTNVLCVKLPNGTSNYAVIGSFYTKNDPPPVTDEMLDYVIYDDGSTMQFDASNGELTWKLKGDLLWDNEKSVTIKLKEDFTLEIDGDVTIKPQGNVSIEAGGDIDIKGQTVNLQGAMKFTGNIDHIGNMHTSGIHQDSLGFHTGGSGVSESWKVTTSPAPNVAGQFKINASTWEGATYVGLNKVTESAADVSSALVTIVAGDQIFVQDKDSPGSYGHYLVTGAGIDHGTWVEYPVTFIDSNGSVPANNAPVIVSAIQPAPALARRFAELEARVAQLENRS